MSAAAGHPDPDDAELAIVATDVLAVFNRAGILAVSDVHVARCLVRLGAGGGGTPDHGRAPDRGPRPEPDGVGLGTGGRAVGDDAVLLGAAFAARAPRLGNVCVDLATVHATADADTDVPVDLSALPWPDPATWPARLAASPLVGEGRPLHLAGSTLYLDRMWADERLVARDLVDRAAGAPFDVDEAGVAARLAAWFGDTDADQQLAVLAATRRGVSVVAGGPGTGKTTTVAKVLALLADQAAAGGHRPPLVALAAPTGRAAARLEEAVREGLSGLAGAGLVPEGFLDGLQGRTIHRLLGFNPANRTRFAHHRANRLPHDVVVVDETSMVSLPLMARLIEAVRPTARLVLVGDPEQLASVEAGAVLGDIVGPAADHADGRGPRVEGAAAPGGSPAEEGTGFGRGVVVLRRVHRFGGAIAALAEAVRRGDAAAAMAVLGDGRLDPGAEPPQGTDRDDGGPAGRANVTWIVPDVRRPEEVLGQVRAVAVARGRQVVELARAGAARQAIGALGSFRLLCGHRRGPDGVDAWTERIAQWLRAEVDGFATGPEWYVGRPLIVTENDYSLQLFNGDTGVVVATPDGRLVAAFERGGTVAEISPTRLAAVDTVYAMTVHKSQGSQYEAVALVVPAAGSRVLTRELLYTAVTRARRQLFVVGSEESVVAAVERPVTRASGLRRALWGSAESQDRAG